MTADLLPRLDLPVSLDAPLTAKTALPRIPAVVTDARVWLRKALTVWDVPEDAADDAVLALSELCTNAVMHAVGDTDEMVVTAAFWHGHLRITVSDPDPAMHRRDPGDSEHGRGLDLVAALSERWGTSRTATGKITFFEMDAGSTS